MCRLFLKPEPKIDARSWMKWAENQIGVKELPGQKHHESIQFYQQFTTLGGPRADEIPWCSDFICAGMELNGYTSTKDALAKSWLNYGIDVKPNYGTILIFQWSNGNYHVGWYVYQDQSKGLIYVLGGNQSNSVCVKPYDARHLVSARFPTENEVE